MKKIYVTPSILSGDFGHLAEEAKKVEKAGADAIHLDIMDGHFVPNLTFGPKTVAAINRATDLFLDVHLMIYNPYDYVEQFIEAGADSITFHFEATEDIEEMLQYIRRCGKEVGLCFNPETSFEMVPKYLDKCDKVLLMSVNPGFGGQKFIPSIVEKIRKTRQNCNERGLKRGGKKGPNLDEFIIQVDGGINEENAKLCVNAGANDLVSGHFLFNLLDMAQGIKTFKALGK